MSGMDGVAECAKVVVAHREYGPAALVRPDGATMSRAAWTFKTTSGCYNPLTPVALSAGTRLGPYEITAPLGAGGMGEVYRARDTQLGREVAIKVLPDTVAADPDRLMRFEREARTLAALNHPHIAHVYGLESNGGSRAIVMELVDGEDLADRVSRGAIPLGEAIVIARQIAEALETAHDAGIVHRDLKPANVKVTPDGRVKVLDFGLAKAFDPATGSQTADRITSSPTVTSPAMTRAGVILGTAAYMSPEQARGKAVDRRADLWAFGCVLYEMLTGARAFDGDTITDVLSAVVSKEPDWSKLPPATPPGVQRLLRRALRKDARARLQSAGDARIELDDAVSGAEPTAPPLSVRQGRWLPALAFAAGGAAAALVALSFVPRGSVPTADPAVMRYAISLPANLQSVGPPVISPDGRWIAIGALGAVGPAQSLAVWLRPMDGQRFQPIAGTEGGTSPFWSPDSREVGFFSANSLDRRSVGTLSRIAVTGGTPARVTEAAGAGIVSSAQLSWGGDGAILLSAGETIQRVLASGGTLTPVTTVEAGKGSHTSPSWIGPDRFLFTELIGGISTGDGVGGLRMQSTAGGPPVRLLEGRATAHYTPQGLLVARPTTTSMAVGTISAHHFDVERGVVEQPGVVIAEDAYPLFSASDTGVLVYRRATAGADHRIQWVNPKGQPIDDGFEASGSGAFNLSRDERMVAFQNGNDIMVRDLTRGVTTRVVQGPGVLEPILSPDGRRVAYSLVVPSRLGIVVRPSAGGPEDLVYTSSEATLVEDWSRDGRFLLGVESTAGRSPNRGLIIPLEKDRQPVVFADLPIGAGLDEPRFSPDGNWIVYNAADGGRQDVYLIPVPSTGERWQLSTDGGAQGRWRADGNGVFYLSPSGQLMEVPVTTKSGQPPQIGRPRVLFETGVEMLSNVDQYAPNAEGTQFLLRRPRSSAGGTELHVIVNWPTLLNQGAQNGRPE